MISAAEKNPDVDISKGRLPGGRAFMSRVSLRGLIRIWQEESAGKTKQMLEACHRRKEGRNIWGMAREMGLAVLLKIYDLIFKFRNKPSILDLLFLTVPGGAGTYAHICTMVILARPCARLHGHGHVPSGTFPPRPARTALADLHSNPAYSNSLRRRGGHGMAPLRDAAAASTGGPAFKPARRPAPAA